MQCILYFLVAVCAILSGGSRVTAKRCEAGQCDTVSNADFSLGNNFFEKTNRIFKDDDATIEVVPRTPVYLVTDLGLSALKSKNLLLMGTTGNVYGRFASNPISVSKSATVRFMFSALVHKAGINGKCVLKGAKSVEYHSVAFSSLKVGEWVTYSYDVPTVAKNRQIRLECSIEGKDDANSVILFDYINICVSFAPGKGLKNDIANKNLLNDEEMVSPVKAWTVTSGVTFTKGQNGDHKVVFAKSAQEESISNKFDSYANRRYSLSGIIPEDLAYVPFKIYIDDALVKANFRPSSSDIDAPGTQFHVSFVAKGTSVNVKIVRPNTENVERTIRPLGLYIHGCAAPKTVKRRTADQNAAAKEEF